MRKITLSTFAASIALTGGCSYLPSIKIERDPTHHERTEAQAARIADERDSATVSHSSAQPVIYDNGVFIAKTTARRKSTKHLPPVFYESTWFNTTIRDINEFAERITLRTKIPSVVGSDVIEALLDRMKRMSELGGQEESAGLNFPPIPVAGPDGAIDSAGNVAADATTDAASAMEMHINYSGGNLKGLLDTVASRYGVSWKYEEGQIRFFMHDTRSFYVRAVPGSSEASATVGSGGSQSTGGGNGKHTTGMTSQLSVWDGLQEAITAMLSEKGRAVTSPATSTVTVTDTPEVLERVAAFIDLQNELMSKQVMLSVEVLTVSSSREHDYSISWDLVYDTLKSRFGLTNLVATNTSGATEMSFGIVGTSNKFNGTRAIVNALAEQGKVSTKHTASVVALNNQPAPIQTGRQFGYVAESSITTTEVGQTTSVTQGQINSGFSMQVLPSIMPDGQVILQFAADITSLRELRSVAVGDVTIEAPDFDSQNFLQRVRMRSGETLVLSGYEADSATRRNAGVGNPFFSLFGGSARGGDVKETTVVLITPVIIN